MVFSDGLQTGGLLAGTPIDALAEQVSVTCMPRIQVLPIGGVLADGIAVGPRIFVRRGPHVVHGRQSIAERITRQSIWEGAPHFGGNDRA